MGVEEIIASIRELVALVLLAVVSTALATARTWVQSKLKDDRWHGANERLERLVNDAVDEVEQTFVRPMKANAGKVEGKCWCDDCKPDAAKMAVARVLRDLGATGMTDIAARLGVDQAGLESRIRTLIEAAINRKKSAART